MKANRFLEKLTSDLPAKILCFVIALFLCLFYQLSLVDKKTVVIPLNVIQDGAVVNVGDVPSSVKVIVRSSSAASNLIHADGITATLNLNYIGDSGTYDVPVFIDVEKDLLALDPLELKSKPEYISVQVEKKVKKAVIVETPVIGEVAHGYMVSNVTTSPNSVYITGAESIVNSISSVLSDTVDVTNIDSGMTFEVHLQQVNKMLEYDEEEFYETKVVLEPLEMDREFRNIKIIPQNLSDEFFLETILPSIDLKLYGRMTVLENYQLPSNAVTIDLRDITEEGEFEVSVRTRVSSYLNIIEKSFDTVIINVVRKPVVEEESGEDPNP